MAAGTNTVLRSEELVRHETADLRCPLEVNPEASQTGPLRGNGTCGMHLAMKAQLFKKHAIASV